GQREQRQHATLAAIVRAQDQRDVFHGNDERQRPKYEGENPQHIGLRYGHAMLAVETLAQGVERAGANISINYAQRAEREGKHEFAARVAQNLRMTRVGSGGGRRFSPQCGFNAFCFHSRLPASASCAVASPESRGERTGQRVSRWLTDFVLRLKQSCTDSCEGRFLIPE